MMTITGRLAFDPVRIQAEAAHGDGKRRPRRRRRPQQLPAVPVRQPDVGDQDVAVRFGHLIAGLRHASRCQNRVTHRLEIASHPFERVAVVLHQENPQCGRVLYRLYIAHDFTKSYATTACGVLMFSWTPNPWYRSRRENGRSGIHWQFHRKDGALVDASAFRARNELP